jgi:hypothetical protein
MLLLQLDRTELTANQPNDPLSFTVLDEYVTKPLTATNPFFVIWVAGEPGMPVLATECTISEDDSTSATCTIAAGLDAGEYLAAVRFTEESFVASTLPVTITVT